MRTRMTIDVGAYERFIIARYFAPIDGTRSRATRAQVRRFALAAISTMVKEQHAALRARYVMTADRLADGSPSRETIARPAEVQQNLLLFG